MATLFAAVFAVFAIHALTTQQARTCHTAASPFIDAADESRHPHSDDASRGVPRTPDGPDGEVSHGHGGAGETCLTLLCVIALLAFALTRGGSHRVLYVLRRASPAHSWIGRTGDPPCLHRLSILRC
ncbi:hypothetical protein [Streptomyces sp. NPDC058739]|uniref:hypothetical protein n=1 Tax=Streptomyces sp. NPDC058739 TaxID=3346618 RepID=UPI0036777D32